MTPNTDPFYPGQPEKAFVVVEPYPIVGVVARGLQGYGPVYDYSDSIAALGLPACLQCARDVVRKYNTALGVTPEQELAAKIGSMRGWSVPGANPASWTREEAERVLHIRELEPAGA